MSTKAIEAVLRHLRNGTKPNGEALDGATTELKALREAAKALDRLHVGDFTYNIRERIAYDERRFIGNTWEHPDVKAWSDASVLMCAIAKETP